jgi:hypothetical protein
VIALRRLGIRSQSNHGDVHQEWNNSKKPAVSVSNPSNFWRLEFGEANFPRHTDAERHPPGSRPATFLRYVSASPKLIPTYGSGSWCVEASKEFMADPVAPGFLAAPQVPLPASINRPSNQRKVHDESRLLLPTTFRLQEPCLSGSLWMPLASCRAIAARRSIIKSSYCCSSLYSAVSGTDHVLAPRSSMPHTYGTAWTRQNVSGAIPHRILLTIEPEMIGRLLYRDG